MEPTFYDEHEYPPAPAGPVDTLKRALTLDLELGRGGKRARQPVPVLSSPDLQLLKLGSPELDRLFMINAVTPSANGVLFPQEPTEEQQTFAQPFMEALDKLHHSDPSLAVEPGRVYANLDGPLVRFPTPVIKDEPQTVPSADGSPPLSPINMDTQERIKLERKRQRNRLAASKCRRRKLERISKLEDKVKVLKGENAELAQMVVKLKDHVHRLKQQVLEHANGGCHIDARF